MDDYFKTLDRVSSDSIKFRLAKQQCNNEKPLVFSIADSDYQTAPAIKAALINRAAHGAFGYIALQESNYQTVIEWFSKVRNLEISKEQLIFTPSVLNSLCVIIQLYTYKKDKILIQTPAYPNFKKVIEANDRTLAVNKLLYENNSYRIDFKDLENQFQNGVKVMILCSPHNPIGKVWGEQDLEKIVNLAKKHAVLLVSDEIHADFIMPGHTFTSIGKYKHNYQRLMILSSIGKTFNVAGIHNANIVTFREEDHEKLKNFYEALHLSTPNLFGITALDAAYNQSKEWVEKQNKHIFKNYGILKECLENHPEVNLLPLEGTYLAWLKVNRNSTSFVKDLASKCVCVSDGKGFITEDNFIRMSLACSTEQLEKGLIIIDQVLSR